MIAAQAKSGRAVPADWIANSGSAAIGQRSLGDPTRLYPLYPPLLEGCPASSTAEMQYPLEIDYDYAKVPAAIFRQPPLPGLDRWAPLLPPLKPGLSIGEGGTPLVQATRLGQWLGLRQPLWLKDESRNPAWSHKDRLNLYVVSTASAANFSCRASICCVPQVFAFPMVFVSSKSEAENVVFLVANATFPTPLFASTASSARLPSRVQNAAASSTVKFGQFPFGLRGSTCSRFTSSWFAFGTSSGCFSPLS